VPAGSLFRGYEDVLVQDLRTSVAVVRYRRERWEAATGERITAALPPGVAGGFGPELRRFTSKTGYVMLDRQLARLHRLKPDLLRAPDRPEIPLHTNGSENDIRTVVTKRKISGGTVSEAGKTARDTMLGLLKTCSKLGVSYFRFLGDRFAVPGAVPVPPLPNLVRLAKA